MGSLPLIHIQPKTLETANKHPFPTQELKTEGGLFEGVFGYYLVYYFLGLGGYTPGSQVFPLLG